ncbi:MAG: ATP-binding cassette domain-containing protein [Methanoregulaceae archaeon]|nr:ATP-binding cassette domain-containing protein [Methanoregulaceae archaeon]
MRLLLEEVTYARGLFSLAVEGEFCEGIHLLNGPVGSGKSTFALLAAGLIRPDSGMRKADGLDRVMLSMQFPEYHVTGFTLGEEARTWGLDPGMVMKRANLPGMENTDLSKLSRGELKRFELSCALSGSYDLLILDEPFSALDCREKQIISRALEQRKEGVTIVITHEGLHLPRVDWIWELESGRLTDLGAVPGAIGRWRFAPPHIRELVDSGVIPENISVRDVLEAGCRIPV